MTSWYLEPHTNAQHRSRLVELEDFPITVGRTRQAGLPISSNEVSRQHAQLFTADGRLWVKDLSSTNGTFVNRQRVEGVQNLKHGDRVQFANMEYRVVSRPGKEAMRRQISEDPDTTLLPKGSREIDSLLMQQRVSAKFQPILCAQDLKCYGYEMLGRGAHNALPESPGPLFQMAEGAGKEVELSELFREKGAETAEASHIRSTFFMNTHPSELLNPDKLYQSMRSLRMRYPDLQLNLEIHEQAVTNTDQIKHLALQLKKLRIGISYDDFGAGQARLLELVDAPPDFLKFDIVFIRDIDRSSKARMHMIQMLLSLCRQLGIKTIAEGVERKEEALACIDLGFDFMQGFYYGKPEALPMRKRIAG